MSSELRHRWTQAGGTIPDSWKIVTLESLLKDSKSIAVGVMYPGPDTIGGVPLIKVGDIKGGQIPQKPTYCISQETNNEHRRTQLIGDELLITLVGNPGECVVVTPAMAGWNPARAIAVIRLSDPELRVYLKTVLESAAGKHLIDAVLNTTVQKTLNLKDVRQLPIPMPPRESIRSLSAFSEALGDRINLLRETNATLEAIAQALFKSWFVDFDPVHANAGTQAPSLPPEIQALFPATFTDSPQGPIPKGWDIGKVEDLMELAYGKALKATDRVEGEVPVYGSGGITGSHNQALVNEPSIIVGRKGTVGSLYWEDRPFFPIDTVFYVKSAKPLSYCFYLLQTLGLHDMNTDGAVPGLNRNNVYRLPVSIPPNRIFHAFDETVAVIRTTIFNNNQQAHSLASLRDTLLPRLISGQLRLPEVEQAIAAIGD